MSSQYNIKLMLSKATEALNNSQGEIKMIERSIFVPKVLYSKAIIEYIEGLVLTCQGSDFVSLDEIHQDKLVALAINAMGGDVDIVFDSASSQSLVQYLISGEKDDEIEFINSIKCSVREQFSDWLEEIFVEQAEIINRNRIEDLDNDADYFPWREMA